MNKPVDPKHLAPSGETPRGDATRPPTESIIERAMRNQPLPRAMRERQVDKQDELDLAYAPDVEWLDHGPAPAIDRITHAPTTTITAATAAPAAEPPKKKEVTRRGFFRNARDTVIGAGTLYAGYKAHGALTAAPAFDFALLKRDETTDRLGVMHRRLSVDDLSGTEEPAKSTFEGLGPLKLASDGRESLIISPDVKMVFPEREYDGPSKDPKKILTRNHDQLQGAKIERITKNIYIPYELFADAADFRVSLRTDANTGKQYLHIGIFGHYEKEDRPITEDIASVAENTKDNTGDIVTGLKNGIIGGIDRIAEATGLGDGVDDLQRRAEEQGKAIRNREGAKPHPQWQKQFSLELDYRGPADLPDLHFFNGHTMDAPTAHIRRETIADALARGDRNGMRIITNNGLERDPMKNNGVSEYKGVRFAKGFEAIEKGAYEASLLQNTSPEDGLVKEAFNGAKTLLWEDKKLNHAEQHSLIMATRFQHNGYEQSLGTGFFERLGNQFQQNVTGTHSFEIGR